MGKTEVTLFQLIISRQLWVPLSMPAGDQQSQERTENCLCWSQGTWQQCYSCRKPRKWRVPTRPAFSQQVPEGMGQNSYLGQNSNRTFNYYLLWFSSFNNHMLTHLQSSIINPVPANSPYHNWFLRKHLSPFLDNLSMYTPPGLNLCSNLCEPLNAGITGVHHHSG